MTAPGTPHENLTYEDVVLGAVFTSRPHEVTPDDIAGFARLTLDHHPLHIDAGYARSRGFPGVIAHGLMGLALMEGLKAEMKLYEHTSVASLGWDDVRFRAPVLAGDTVRVRFRFADKRPSRRPDRGIVVETLELINQRDEPAITGRHSSLVLTRHGVCSSRPGDDA